MLFCMWPIKMSQKWPILRPKQLIIQPEKAFLQDFFISRDGSPMAVSDIVIFTHPRQFFSQNFCIRLVWNTNIPLLIDCAVQERTPSTCFLIDREICVCIRSKLNYLHCLLQTLIRFTALLVLTIKRKDNCEGSHHYVHKTFIIKIS